MRIVSPVLGALLALMSLAGPAAAAEAADPFTWLEDFSSPRVDAWVADQNGATLRVLAGDPRYQGIYDQAFALASAKDRIPEPSFLAGGIYNVWHDADHLRGLWRRTSLANYLSPNPHWTSVLDIDALGKAEKRSWVFKGAACLEPEERLCLVHLSDGGADAVEIREFELASAAFVKDGFRLPPGKQSTAWEDADHLLVAREWAPGDLTAASYPYIVKRLARGQSLAAAQEIYRGEKTDTGVHPIVLTDGEGRKLSLIVRSLDTFRSEFRLIAGTTTRPLALPAKSDIAALLAGRLIVTLHEDWTVGRQTFPAGAVVSLDLDAVKADPGELNPSLVWAPGPREALADLDATRDRLLLAVLDNVRGRAFIYAPDSGGGWTRRQLDLPDNLTVGFSGADRHSDQAFVETTGFLTPDTLLFANADTGALVPAKALPAKFDASADIVEQHEAVSRDGTRVPYFLVRRRDLPRDGSTPTLLTAYGGFEVSQTPYYSALIGKLWLERGGALALANIRGGGEFGPAWHEAAIGVKRQATYDDFTAVAQDLIGRRITSPRRLGIEGGSNGGLLVGVAMVQQPELYRAVVIAVPLLDMIRIGKIAAGASWQGEYGDPDTDPAVRAFWLKTSPYQNLKAGVAYPEPLVWTTIRDDRVGPQHARKFAARMEAMGLPALFYEVGEGGHAAGADIAEAARTNALMMTYLIRKLVD